MNYKNQKEAINKIARELGQVRGTVSLPKTFSSLKKEAYGRTIPKSSHIVNLLATHRGQKKRFEVLQKIFALHLNMDQTMVRELRPALNKLGFEYKNGVIVKFNLKMSSNLRTRARSKIRKYSKSSSLISEAIFEKGDKLSSSYLVIYLIENHLRLFIWKVAGKSNRKLFRIINNKERSKIADRKKKERQNRWIPLRKDSNLFYLDIEDLGTIIQRNWAIFKTHFPDQHWINTKIQEVSLIRNRIAHNNSFISDTEKKALELYMDQIFHQIK